MGLLKLLGIGREEKTEIDFKKYVDSLSSEEFEKLEHAVHYRNLHEKLDETRRVLAYENSMRCAGLSSRY